MRRYVIALVFGYGVIGCDEVDLSAQELTESGQVTATLAESETCIDEGVWEKGTVYGMDDLAEMMAVALESCPHLGLDRNEPTVQHEIFRVEPSDQAPPSSFCMTDHASSERAVVTPSRRGEATVVEARYDSDVDFSRRLASLPQSDLADKDSIKTLVGIDGRWRPPAVDLERDEMNEGAE